MASDIQKTVMWVALTLAFLCYSLYLYSSLPVQDATYSAEVDRGKAIWQQHNCIACHQVYGLGGYLGPDLTNVYSLRGPDYITVFLKYGNQTMPAYQMEASDIQAMLAYLRNIDQSGVSDPRSFNANYDGTIEQQQK